MTVGLEDGCPLGTDEGGCVGDVAGVGCAVVGSGEGGNVGAYDG